MSDNFLQDSSFQDNITVVLLIRDLNRIQREAEEAFSAYQTTKNSCHLSNWSKVITIEAQTLADIIRFFNPSPKVGSQEIIRACAVIGLDFLADELTEKYADYVRGRGVNE